MYDLELALKLMEDTYDKIYKIATPEAFLSFILTLIDQWMVDHNVPFDRQMELINAVPTLVQQAHDQLGEMERSNKAVI